MPGAARQASEAAPPFRPAVESGDGGSTVQQALHDGTRFIVINPVHSTHTSVALRDAFAAVKLLHRGAYLKRTCPRTLQTTVVFSPISAQAVICGLGTAGYTVAIGAALAHLGFSEAPKLKTQKWIFEK